MVEPKIEIRGMKDVDLKGGIVFDSFPSSGLANAIASGCLIHSFKTEFVAVLDSPAFPALSVICNSAPNFPARVYTNDWDYARPSKRRILFPSSRRWQPSATLPGRGSHTAASPHGICGSR